MLVTSAAQSGAGEQALSPVGALSHDGWGHGAAEVEAAWNAATIESPRAEHASDAASASSVDAATLFGLPLSSGRPVMRLAGAVLSVKPLRAGEGVSYGYIHRATADTRVALITGGYAQGVVRSLGNRIDVTIGGRPHRVIGRVAMDVCVVDIGDADVHRGDEVVFFGDPADGVPSLEPWCILTGMTAAEIVTMVGQRATREVVA